MSKDTFEPLNVLELLEEVSEEEKKSIDVKRAEINLIKNLKDFRKRKGMSQKEISEISGLTQQMVSRIETYGNKPTLRNFLRYLLALDIDIEKILG